MRKLLIFTFVFSFANQLYSQSFVFAEIQINAIAANGDTLKLTPPKSLKIEKFGCTEIFSIGKIKGFEYGVQIELLHSKMAMNDRLVKGVAYFIKKNDKWEVLIDPQYSEEDYNTITSKLEIDSDEYSDNSLDVGRKFYIEFREGYYFFK